MRYKLKDERLIDCIDGDDLLINCILKTWTNQHGHQYVQMTAPDGSRSKELVHRLVAKTFIPNPDKYPIVRHLDDDPTNNDVGNLAWGTPADNVRDMYINGTGSKKKVYCHELDMTFDCGCDAAAYFGVSRSDISFLCSGKNKLLQGKYHLSFLEEVDNFGRRN